MKIIDEFKEFLTEYKVIGLAVAFIMAVAATALVQSLVNDVIMPVVSLIIPGGEWQTISIPLAAGKAMFVGKFLGALINFLILAFVVFMIAKMVLKEEKVAKK
jgi:large conductance mechanosensitive channel